MDIDLQIERGSVVTLLGPNGAGKSTILKMLSGETAPQQGRLSIFGQPHGADARRCIGLALQEPSTDDLMTLRETLELHGRLFGLRGQRLRDRCGELLESLGLGERDEDRCETLSGGLRRRLDIARALLHEPELLLLDEPTLALDPDSSEAIWSTLHERVAGGAAAVVCSNDTAEAEAHADRVVFVNDGRIVADDSPANLTANLLDDAIELDWSNVAEAELEELRSWSGVGDAVGGPGSVLLTVDRTDEIIPRLFQTYGGRISGLRTRRSSLLDAWFRIVGRPISEGQGREAAT